VLLHVRVSPQASRNLIKQEGAALKAYLTKPAQDGLANHQLIELLAKHFKVKIYQVTIIRGENSRDKVVKIDA